jgi:GT2 family glycosyltransferase
MIFNSATFRNTFKQQQFRMLDISVIIVTYNSSECIQACLDSVCSQKGVDYEVIVVDNTSSDDTLLKVRNNRCLLLESGENIGFGRACNLGMSQSKGRYIFLLNPDARLTDESDLAQVCRLMDENPRWGLAGAKVLSQNGSLESPPAREYPGQKHVQRDFSQLPGSISWVIGAAMIVRRDIYLQLGGFDPDFFLYSEETDLCLRVRESGYEIGWLEDVAVKHIGGESEKGVDPSDTACRKLRGLLTFRTKHYAHTECVFLANRDRRRAFFRMIANGLLALVRGKKSTAWEKHRMYRGVWKTSKHYLASA